MFGYNITSLVIILVIALLLFGPKRLPELGDSIGKAIKGFKKATEGDLEPPPPPGGELRAGAPENTAAAPEKTCPQCHKTMGGDFAFCPHCGQKA
jgi:sec-independent protein translocase protein TatA